MADELQIASLGLIIDPDSITLDRAGRVAIRDPKILQAILAAVPQSLDLEATATNYVACGNNYQCGVKQQ